MTDRPRVETLSQNTDEVEPERAFAYWRDTALAMSGVSPDTQARRSFSAKRLVAVTGNTTLLHTHGRRIDCERTAQHIRRDGRDAVTITVFLRGSGYLEQYGQGARVLPGDLSLTVSNRPYRIGAFEDYEEIRLAVPRALFTRIVGEPEALIGRRFERNGPTLLLSNYLQGYAGMISQMSQTEADVAVEGALHLLRGLVDRPLVDPSMEALRTLAMVQVERRLHDPNFGPEALRANLNVSRSRLYAAFARDGDNGEGVAGAIRETRLSRAHQRLCDPHYDRHSIAAIARECGFADPSSFSHAFRRRFGLSARDLRALRGSV